MRTNRNPSAEDSINKKQRLNTDDIINLSSEEEETIESGFEELSIANNPQAIKKTVPENIINLSSEEEETIESGFEELSIANNPQAIKKTVPENIINLSSEEEETIASGFEELSIANNPQAIKKTVPENIINLSSEEEETIESGFEELSIANNPQAIKKTVPENIINLSSEEEETIASGFEELSIANNPQAIKKTVPENIINLSSEEEETIESGFEELSIANNPQAIKKTVPENIINLTSEDDETIESGFEEFNNANNFQAIKKRIPKTDKQNKSPKEAKGKINTKNDDKPTENTNRKKSKKEKPKLQLQCKSHHCSFYLAVEKTKSIWELMRRDDCPEKKKETLLKDLFKHSKPHLQTMVYSPDTICIVQCMLKLGTPEIRSQIINELIKHVPKMMFCKYACSSVKNMLKQGDEEQRKMIINSLKGNVYRYTLHTNSTMIMDLMYTTYATPEQKYAMMHELYGASSILCDSPNLISLTDILENSPGTKDIILGKTKEHIKNFVLKQKTSMQTTLVHNLIYEYIDYTGLEKSDELITLLKEFPIELFYTSKCGCHLAMYIIWSANSKEYKSILKNIKSTGATRGLATSEYGYLILFAVLDSIPDTDLVKETIIPEILQNLEAIATNEYGRRFILSLAIWRRSFFNPQDNDLKKKAISSKKCIKNDSVQVKKLLDAISEGFLQHIQNDPKFWFSSLEMATVLEEILQSCSGLKLKEAMTSVANFIIDPKNKLKDEIFGKVPVYEHYAVNVVLRMIIGHDKILARNNEATFSEVLSSIITTDTLKSWVKCNSACNLLVKIMDSGVELAVRKIKSLFSTTIMDLLKQQQFAGAEVLVTKLSSIATNE